MVFAIVFGLSMDYEVFLVSRIHEEWTHGADNSTAVREGLIRTGRVITAAAAVMVVVFASFIGGGERVIELFGLALASAVFLDALVIRVLMLPATLQILGERTWWFPALAGPDPSPLRARARRGAPSGARGSPWAGAPRRRPSSNPSTQLDLRLTPRSPRHLAVPALRRALPAMIISRPSGRPRSPRPRGDAHHVPLAQVADLVLQLRPRAGEDHVDLLLLAVAVPDRRPEAGA